MKYTHIGCLISSSGSDLVIYFCKFKWNTSFLGWPFSITKNSFLSGVETQWPCRIEISIFRDIWWPSPVIKPCTICRSEYIECIKKYTYSNFLVTGVANQVPNIYFLRSIIFFKSKCHSDKCFAWWQVVLIVAELCKVFTIFSFHIFL